MNKQERTKAVELEEAITVISPIMTEDLVEETPVETKPTAPLVVVSKTMMEYALTAARRSLALVVDTKETFDQAAAFLNEIGKSRTAISTRALALGKPFRDFAAKLTAAGRRITDPLELAEQVINEKMREFRRLEAVVRAEAMEKAERLRKQAELEASEAAKRQAQGEAKLEAAKTEKGFETAGQAFQAGVAVEQRAQETAQAAETVLAQVQAKPTTAKGIRSRKVAVLLDVDKKQLPVEYLMVDEVKLKQAILMDLVTDKTPGVKFRIDEVFSGSGR